MCSDESRHRVWARVNAAEGFTRMELAAVLAMAALLAMVGLSARAGGRDQGLVAQCAGNLRQLALALQLYGNENGDKLPANQNTGSWVSDVPWSVGTTLLQYLPLRGTTNLTVSWKTFYCPGTGWRFTDSDNYSLWNYNPSPSSGYRVAGYAMTFSGTLTLNSTNANPTLTPQPIAVVVGFLPAPQASRRVLVADATVTPAGQSNPSLKSSYNWTSIQGGYPVRHTSPHLAGTLPAGCNVAMLDGHVEWRSFSRLLNRTTGAVPVFWW